ncbi:MAG: stability determinant [Janthinobacterium svalbardensis]|uniref:type II toxin-antitoxin system RelB family antitoxin n=1 Tax=Janthinobacterium svalbardensis TaxID=368607 RepID=UPI0012FDED05|nr:stability determinant [Janthinobacterium svalbardensis]
MNATPSSTTSEFATTEAAETYEHWFHAKVLASLNDDRPTAPHEAVMVQLRKIVTPQTDGHAADSMEG